MSRGLDKPKLTKSRLADLIREFKGCYVELYDEDVVDVWYALKELQRRRVADTPEKL